MKKTRNILLIICFLSTIISCNKEYDKPRVNEIPFGNYISIDDLKNLLETQGVGTSTCPENIRLLIDTNYSISGVITTEETNGALYKEAYMQDESGAIKLQLNSAGGLYIGDSIRIFLKGLTIEKPYNTNCTGQYNIQLNNIDVNLQVTKIATNKFIEPHPTSIDQINLDDDESSLIRLENVEFETPSNTYADAIGLTTGENNLIDCNGKKIQVRTSGYANFASDSLPCGNGNIIGILTRFGDTEQFLIRDINEVELDSARCDGSYCGDISGGSGGTGNNILYKDFSDGSITSGGWKNFWSGTSPNIGEWEIYSTFGSNGDVAKASNYSNNTNYACESWLVSPLVDLSSTSSPYLVFDNTTKYSGDPLELYISGDYDGTSNPDMSGTWVNITSYVPTILDSNGNFLSGWDSDLSSWDLVSSGNIDLTPFISSNVAIAFKYTGSNNSGATWEVDNILITE